MSDDYYGSMVERVAKAVYAHERFQPALYDAEEGWKRDREEVRARYRAKARAVITAMRSPTEKMETEGIIYVQKADDGTGESWDYVAGTWTVMIDAALDDA